MSIRSLENIMGRNINLAEQNINDANRVAIAIKSIKSKGYSLTDLVGDMNPRGRAEFYERLNNLLPAQSKRVEVVVHCRHRCDPFPTDFRVDGGTIWVCSNDGPERCAQFILE